MMVTYVNVRWELAGLGFDGDLTPSCGLQNEMGCFFFREGEQEAFSGFGRFTQGMFTNYASFILLSMKIFDICYIDMFYYIKT